MIPMKSRVGVTHVLLTKCVPTETQMLVSIMSDIDQQMVTIKTRQALGS